MATVSNKKKGNSKKSNQVASEVKYKRVDNHVLESKLFCKLLANDDSKEAQSLKQLICSNESGMLRKTKIESRHANHSSPLFDYRYRLKDKLSSIIPTGMLEALKAHDMWFETEGRPLPFISAAELTIGQRVVYFLTLMTQTQMLTEAYASNIPVDDMEQWIKICNDPSTFEELIEELSDLYQMICDNQPENNITQKKLSFAEYKSNDYPMTPLGDDKGGQEDSHEKESDKVNDSRQSPNVFTDMTLNRGSTTDKIIKGKTTSRLSYSNSNRPKGIFLHEFEDVVSDSYTSPSSSSSSSSSDDDPLAPGKCISMGRRRKSKKVKKRKKRREKARAQLFVSMPTSNDHYFYRGTPKEAKLWLSKVSLFIQQTQPDDPVKVVRHYLRGDAKDWLHRLSCSYNGKPTWSQFVKAFKAHYTGISVPSASKFYATKQKKNTLYEYLLKLLRHKEESGMVINDYEVIKVFVKGANNKQEALSTVRGKGSIQDILDSCQWEHNLALELGIESDEEAITAKPMNQKGGRNHVHFTESNVPENEKAPNEVLFNQVKEMVESLVIKDEPEVNAIKGKFTETICHCCGEKGHTKLYCYSRCKLCDKSHKKPEDLCEVAQWLSDNKSSLITMFGTDLPEWFDTMVKNLNMEGHL